MVRHTFPEPQKAQMLSYSLPRNPPSHTQELRLGSPVTVSYIPLLGMVSETRRTLLRDSYFFDCDCDACTTSAPELDRGLTGFCCPTCGGEPRMVGASVGAAAGGAADGVAGAVVPMAAMAAAAALEARLAPCQCECECESKSEPHLDQALWHEQRSVLTELTDEAWASIVAGDLGQVRCVTPLQLFNVRT